MAKNKFVKIIPSKSVVKKGASKVQIKTTAAKRPGIVTPVDKKKLSGKLVVSTKPKSVNPSKISTKSAHLTKKEIKPILKTIAAKKSLTVKKSAVPVKEMKLPQKSTPVVKTQPNKEAKKAPPKNITAPPLPDAKSIKVPPPKPIVLPKITTTKARKYEPEFTKSVLDQAIPENNGPTMRYSDAELNEFRELILRKLETAKKELGYLQGLITRKDEMGGDETDNRYMTMEDGSLSMEREQLSQMASRQITFIDHLEKAMMRIENKTYGICRVTGKLIDKARLRAVPHATLSIEAKMGIAK